jgi:hypothetical protein
MLTFTVLTTFSFRVSAQATCENTYEQSVSSVPSPWPMQFYKTVPSEFIQMELPTWEVISPHAREFGTGNTILISECNSLDKMVLERARLQGDVEIGGVAIVTKTGTPLSNRSILFSSGERQGIAKELVFQAVHQLLIEIPEQKYQEIDTILITHNHPKFRNFPTLSSGDLDILREIGNKLRITQNLRHARVILSAVQNTSDGRQYKHSHQRILLY